MKLGGIITLFTNSVLIYLTYNKIRTIHSTYKCLIILVAVLGIVFSMLELVATPFTHSFNKSLIYFSCEDVFMKVGLLCCYSTIYMMIICCLAIQFIYRYLILLSSKYMMLFEGWKLTIWLIYVATCSVVWAISLRLLSPDDYSNRYLKEEMKKHYEVDVEYIASLPLVAYDEFGNIRLQNFVELCFLSAVLVFQYVLMIYFGVKTHYGIKRIVTIKSAKNHRLHAQLFKTLVLQITIPSIFYNSPLFITYIIPYLDISISYPSGIIICVFSLYPAVDSLLLMWMVHEYHKLIKSMFFYQLITLIRRFRNNRRCVKCDSKVVGSHEPRHLDRRGNGNEKDLELIVTDNY